MTEKRWLAPEWLYTPDGLAKGKVLIVSAKGEVLDVVSADNLPADTALEHIDGILTPGLVNAHSHLELSALRGKIPPGTGMAAFAGAVSSQRRSLSPDEIAAAIGQAMDELHATGTALVGDIANDDSTIGIKAGHPLATYTFFETFGLMEPRASTLLEKCFQLENEAIEYGLAAGVTLHAPYSILPAVRQKVWTHARAQGSRLSLHMLESAAEREIFATGTGHFAEFYQQIGVSLPDFGTHSPLEYLLRDSDPSQPVLLVHTTEISPDETADFFLVHNQGFICLCPRSNDWIHSRWPQLATYLPYPDRICLGTDSLASNASLNVAEEVLACLQLAQEQGIGLDVHTVLRWATTNGAQALGMGHLFGDWTTGTKPGVLAWPWDGKILALPTVLAFSSL